MKKNLKNLVKIGIGLARLIDSWNLKQKEDFFCDESCEYSNFNRDISLWTGGLKYNSFKYNGRIDNEEISFDFQRGFSYHTELTVKKSTNDIICYFFNNPGVFRKNSKLCRVEVNGSEYFERSILEKAQPTFESYLSKIQEKFESHLPKVKEKTNSLMLENLNKL